MICSEVRNVNFQVGKRSGLLFYVFDTPWRLIYKVHIRNRNLITEKHGVVRLRWFSGSQVVMPYVIFHAKNENVTVYVKIYQVYNIIFIA